MEAGRKYWLETPTLAQALTAQRGCDAIAQRKPKGCSPCDVLWAPFTMHALTPAGPLPFPQPSVASFYPSSAFIAQQVSRLTEALKANPNSAIALTQRAWIAFWTSNFDEVFDRFSCDPVPLLFLPQACAWRGDLYIWVKVSPVNRLCPPPTAFQPICTRQKLSPKRFPNRQEPLLQPLLEPPFQPILRFSFATCLYV